MHVKGLDKIENKRMRNLYTAMWSDNSVVKTADITQTEAVRGRYSKNSYSFKGDDKAETLIRVFGIPKEKEKLFREKFRMACDGSGQEYRRITTLHSSSLCALLFFYNVTEDNKLTIDEVGTFDNSVFEFRSPVVNKNHESCMDVVLTGTDKDGVPVVLFLESKFSEYYTSSSGCSNGISKKYLTNGYSEHFYTKEFLQQLGLKRSEVKKECFSLYSEDECYIGGIKQMISHYVGIRNNIDGNFSKQKEAAQQGVVDMIKAGAKVYLAEILFDDVIGDFTLTNGVSCRSAYAETYTMLSEKMNHMIAKEGLKNQFCVLPHELGYSMFKNSEITYHVDEKVLTYYFGGVTNASEDAFFPYKDRRYVNQKSNMKRTLKEIANIIRKSEESDVKEDVLFRELLGEIEKKQKHVQKHVECLGCNTQRVTEKRICRCMNYYMKDPEICLNCNLLKKWKNVGDIEVLDYEYATKYVLSGVGGMDLIISDAGQWYAVEVKPPNSQETIARMFAEILTYTIQLDETLSEASTKPAICFFEKNNGADSEQMKQFKKLMQEKNKDLEYIMQHVKVFCFKTEDQEDSDVVAYKISEVTKGDHHG